MFISPLIDYIDTEAILESAGLLVNNSSEPVIKHTCGNTLVQLKDPIFGKLFTCKQCRFTGDIISLLGPVYNTNDSNAILKIIADNKCLLKDSIPAPVVKQQQDYMSVFAKMKTVYAEYVDNRVRRQLIHGYALMTQYGLPDTFDVGFVTRQELIKTFPKTQLLPIISSTAQPKRNEMLLVIPMYDAPDRISGFILLGKRTVEVLPLYGPRPWQIQRQDFSATFNPYADYSNGAFITDNLLLAIGLRAAYTSAGQEFPIIGTQLVGGPYSGLINLERSTYFSSRVPATRLAELGTLGIKNVAELPFEDGGTVKFYKTLDIEQARKYIHNINIKAISVVRAAKRRLTASKNPVAVVKAVVSSPELAEQVKDACTSQEWRKVIKTADKHANTVNIFGQDIEVGDGGYLIDGVAVTNWTATIHTIYKFRDIGATTRVPIYCGKIVISGTPFEFSCSSGETFISRLVTSALGKSSVIPTYQIKWDRHIEKLITTISKPDVYDVVSEVGWNGDCFDFYGVRIDDKAVRNHDTPEEFKAPFGKLTKADIVNIDSSTFTPLALASASARFATSLIGCIALNVMRKRYKRDIYGIALGSADDVATEALTKMFDKLSFNNIASYNAALIPRLISCIDAELFPAFVCAARDNLGRILNSTVGSGKGLNAIVRMLDPAYTAARIAYNWKFIDVPQVVDINTVESIMRLLPKFIAWCILRKKTDILDLKGIEEALVLWITETCQESKLADCIACIKSACNGIRESTVAISEIKDALVPAFSMAVKLCNPEVTEVNGKPVYKISKRALSGALEVLGCAWLDSVKVGAFALEAGIIVSVDNTLVMNLDKTILDLPIHLQHLRCESPVEKLNSDIVDFVPSNTGVRN